MNSYSYGLLAALLTLAAHAPALAETQPIRVLVYGEHQGENIVYHYTVINNGTDGFYNFTIGNRYDKTINRTIYELVKFPLGWKYGREGEGGTAIILDPNSTTQPPGWAPEIIGQVHYSLVWHILPENKATTPPLAPAKPCLVSV